MKRASALIMALLFCLTFSFTVFADDIFIIEDGEDEFVPDVQTTTTQPAETTTAVSGYEDILDSDTLGGYFDSIKDKLGDGIDSLLGGFDSWDSSGETTTSSSSSSSSGLPSINAGSYTPSNQSSSMTTSASAENTTASQQAEQTTSAENTREELPSVLVVNNGEDSSWGISGSTLTLLVFIAGIIILVLVVVIVLIIMTRRTEFDSAVKNRSTLPSVEQPDSLAQFIENDEVDDDGSDYSNITYWDDGSGS